MKRLDGSNESFWTFHFDDINTEKTNNLFILMVFMM